MPVELIVGAAVGAAAASERVRKALRRGLVYGVGGVLVAYDKMTAMAHGVRRTVHQATASPTAASPSEPANPTQAPAPAQQTVAVNPSSPAATPS